MGKIAVRIVALTALVVVVAVALFVWAKPEPDAAPSVSPSPAAISGDPHGELLDLIRSTSDKPELMTNLQNDLMATFASDPRFVRIENASPGATREMVAEMGPLMKKRSDRLFAEHRPELIAVIKSGLTASEADEARRFFASPTGGRMLQLVASNATARETYGSMVSGKAESDAEVAVHMQKDRDTMGQRVREQLTAEDKAQIERELSSQPWIRNFSKVMPEFKAELARLENEPLSAEEEKAMTEIVERVLKKRGLAK